MTQLIIVSGPSGVGKNTLVDAVTINYPRIKYFRKVTTRDKRPDDRDEEARFVPRCEFKRMQSQHRIAMPYEVRGEHYGLPVESFAELKEDARIICLSDFQLIKSLREAFDTTTVYVTAPLDVIVKRLEQRKDTADQRKKSIESAPEHLKRYKRFRGLFDYEITNGRNLESAQEQMLEVIREEVLPHRRMYNFLMPYECSQEQAQRELSTEGGTYTSLPAFSQIQDRLEKTLQPFYFGSGIHPIACTYINGSVTVSFYHSQDRERENIAFGSIELQGPKKGLATTGELIEKTLPELKRYEAKQVRIKEK